MLCILSCKRHFKPFYRGVNIFAFHSCYHSGCIRIPDMKLLFRTNTWNQPIEWHLYPTRGSNKPQKPSSHISYNNHKLIDDVWIILTNKTEIQQQWVPSTILFTVEDSWTKSSELSYSYSIKYNANEWHEFSEKWIAKYHIIANRMLLTKHSRHSGNTTMDTFLFFICSRWTLWLRANCRI